MLWFQIATESFALFHHSVFNYMCFTMMFHMWGRRYLQHIQAYLFCIRKHLFALICLFSRRMFHVFCLLCFEIFHSPPKSQMSWGSNNKAHNRNAATNNWNHLYNCGFYTLLNIIKKGSLIDLVEFTVRCNITEIRDEKYQSAHVSR